MAHGRLSGQDEAILPEYDGFARVLDPTPVFLGTGDKLDLRRLKDCRLLIWEWGWTDTASRIVQQIGQESPIHILMFPCQLDRYWRELDITSYPAQMGGLRATHSIGVMLEDTCAYYRAVAPHANVFHMPVPVAVDYFHGLSKPLASRNPNRLLLTAPSRFTGRSSQMHIATYLAFRELRRRFTDLQGVAFVYDDNERKELEIILRDLELTTAVDVRSYMRPIDRFVAAISDCYAGMCLSSGLVQGRLALISACIGVPMVLTNEIETHRRLFPDTAVNWFDIDGAVERCSRLFADPAYHKRVCETAFQSVRYYDVPACRERMIQGTGLQ